MAYGGSIQLPDFSKSNALFDPQAIAQDAARTQIMQNSGASGTQDLADRATLRGNALGLSTRDALSLATAASLGASGQGAVNALSTMDTQTAASKLAALQYSAGLPQWGAPAGGVASAGASAAPSGGDIEDRLAAGESGNKPGIVNKQGYSGLFQFGTGRLTDLGLYQPAQGENPNANQWRGTITVPGFQPISYQQFLASPDAQRAAMHVHVGNIDQAINETPGADRFNRDGLVAVAHLGGVGGMQRFVQSGGRYSPGDSNGTTLPAYYNRYSQAGRTQLAADHGHPQGPLPGYDHTAPDPFGGAAAAVQVASAAGTAGMPQTMTDAAPAGASQGASLPVPPIPPAGGPPPARGTDDVTSVDTLDGAQGLPAGARFSVAGGPIQARPGGPQAQPRAAAPAVPMQADERFPPDGGTVQPSQARITPEMAVQQAQRELAPQQAGMAPDAANQQVVQRAQQLMGGGGGAGQPAAAQGPQTGSAAAGPPPSTMSQGLQRRPLAAPSGQGTNTLYSPAMAGAAPMQPNQLGMVQAPGPGGAPQPGTQSPPGEAGDPPMPAAQPIPQLVRTGTGALYTQGAPAGFGYEQGTGRIVPIPGTQKLEIKDAGPLRSFIDPHTGQTVRTEAIPDHSRPVFRDVQGGTQQYQSGQPVGPIIPYSGRPEQTAAYHADVGRTGDITASVQVAQSNAPRLNEMADLAGQLQTGPTAELRVKGAAYLEALGVSPDRIKWWTGLSSGSAAQEFIKLSVQAAGADAKSNVGSNNGIQSIQLYQSANPGMQLLPDANKRVTNMMRVANQATQDYGQGALAHFGDQEDGFLHRGAAYTPLTAFNRQWQGQNNPQVYAAATGILNGDPFEKWRARLSSPDEGQRAAQIAARVDPNVMIPGNGGGSIPARQFLQRVR